MNCAVSLAPLSMVMGRSPKHCKTCSSSSRACLGYLRWGNAFSHKWEIRNSIPLCRPCVIWHFTELKLLRSTDSFRRDLKTFLFDSVYIRARGYGLTLHVMRPRSSSRGRNTSASVTLTLTVYPLSVIPLMARL